MKKDKVLSILKSHKDEFNEIEIYFRVWLVQTKSYVEKFFGKDSAQYEYITNFIAIHSTRDYSQNDFFEITKFVDYCISNIQNTDVYKPPKQNLLNRIPDWSIMPIITAFLILGAIYGRYQKDVAFIRLEEKLKNIEISSPVIPGKDMTYDEKGAKDKSNTD